MDQAGAKKALKKARKDLGESQGLVAMSKPDKKRPVADEDSKEVRKKQKKENKAKKLSETTENPAESSPTTPTSSADAIDSSEKTDKDEKQRSKKEKKEKKKAKEKKDKKSKDKQKKREVVTPSGSQTPSADVSNVSTPMSIDSNLSTATSQSEDKAAAYVEHHSLKSLPQSTIDAFLEEHKVQSSEDIRPILEFHQAGFPEDLMNVVKDFAKPTPIQSVSWPIVLAGRDEIGIAKTGSGKTLAFTLPALQHIKTVKKTQGKTKHPNVLVVAPTRELAMQTQEIAEAAGKQTKITSVCIYGGVPKDAQRQQLSRGVDIVVATPGRLVDLLDEGALDISNVSYLVLDEADRMLDVGFEDAVRKIIGLTRKDRQTLMFSATWPESVQKLAHDFLMDPVRVSIGSTDLAANSDVQQIVDVVQPFEKEQKLVQLLNKYHKSRKNRVLVFVLYKKEATRIEQMLQRNGFKPVAIHGDRNQQQRTEALNRFKDGSFPLLIATDVAARGLDIPDVGHVINFTFPLTIEDYVHRIGRTGRGGAKGTSHTLFTMHDKSHSGELINILKQAGQPVPEDLLKFGGTVKKKEHSAYGAFFKDVDMTAKPTKITFD